MATARHKIEKVAISPESTNYGDNADNVAYLYRGYYIWREDREYCGDRGGTRVEWHLGVARYVEPDVALGEDFLPYWDDCGRSQTYDSRRTCIAVVDQFENANA